MEKHGRRSEGENLDGSKGNLLHRLKRDGSGSIQPGDWFSTSACIVRYTNALIQMILHCLALVKAEVQGEDSLGMGKNSVV